LKFAPVYDEGIGGGFWGDGVGVTVARIRAVPGTLNFAARTLSFVPL
jgi:hypothetical protein